MWSPVTDPRALPNINKAKSGDNVIEPTASLEVVDHDLDFSPIHQRMQFYVDQEILPCCSTIVMRGTDVYDYATFGYMDRDTALALRDDAIYRMYSNTKIVTSVALMMLYEAGKFALDDPISKFMPEFAEPRVLKADASSAEEVEAAETPILIKHILSLE